MNCQEFLSLLPRYLDDLPDEVRETLLVHASECADCAEKLATHEAMLASLQSLDDDLEVPEVFSVGWRSAIREEKPSIRTPWYARWQGWTAAATMVCAIIGGTALMRGGYIFPEVALYQTATQPIESVSRATATNDVPYEVAAYEAEVLPAGAMDGGTLQAYSADTLSKRSDAVMVSDEAESDTVDGGSNTQQAVVLRTASISLDSDQYDVDVARIQAHLNESEGWVEYQSVYGESLTANAEGGGRHAYLRVRVPASGLDDFLAMISSVGRITGTETAAEDVSSSYYDVQGRLTMYTAQRDRLTELLSEAQDMQNIIEIEGRLSEVQYTIESLTGSLNRWDSSAQNATVSINITEVAKEREYARLLLSQRITEAFSRSWLAARAFLADMLVFLVMIAPYLVFLATVVAIIYLIYRAVRRGKQKGGNETK